MSNTVYSRVETMEMFANTGQLIDNYSQWVHEVDCLKQTGPFSKSNLTSLSGGSLAWGKNLIVLLDQILELCVEVESDAPPSQKFQMKFDELQSKLQFMERRKQKGAQLVEAMSSLSINEIQDLVIDVLVKSSDQHVNNEMASGMIGQENWLSDGFHCAVQDYHKIKAFGNLFHAFESNARRPESITSKIIDYMNQQDTTERISKVTKSVVVLCDIFRAILDEDSQNLPQRIQDMKQNMERIEIENTKVRYEKKKMLERIQNLDWGPEHYHRRPEFIKKAQTSLEKNQILGLTGIGGVGKTALAHKLMWDLIHKDEFEYYVPWTSKLGSEQGTLNLKKGGIETTTSKHTIFYSMYPEDGPNLRGAFRFVLTNIITAVPSHSSTNFSNMDDDELIEKTIEILKKHKMLLLIDNYEDIEENTDNEDIKKIHTQFTKFFNMFSGTDSDSKIIITTRGDADIATSRLPVEFLDSGETVELFRNKIGNLAYKEKDIETKTKLQEIYKDLASDGPLKMLIRDQFEAWPGESGEHPCLVLGAAYDIKDTDGQHITTVLSEWGNDNDKAAQILDYATSKTLSNFERWQIELIKKAAKEIGVNRKINSEVLGDLFERNWRENNKALTAVEKERFLSELSRRQFLLNLEGNAGEYAWNVPILQSIINKYDITVMSRQTDTKQYTEQIIEFKNITQYIEQFSRLDNWIHADKNKQTISEQNKIAGVVYGEQLKIMKTFVQQFKSYLRDNDPNHVPSDDVDKLLVQACLSSFQFLDHMTSLLKLDMKLGRFDYAQGRQRLTFQP